MIRDGVVRRAISLCAAGFERPEIPDAVLALTRDAVPFDLACWGLLDPITHLPTSNSSTTAMVVGERVWEYELTVPDVITLRELLHSKPSVGILSVATGGDPTVSPRFRGLLGPHLEITDELRAALTVGGVGWGWMSLMRRSGTPFAERDGARIATLVPHLAAALRAAALRAAALTNAVDDAAPATAGVAIVDADGELDSATPTGCELLDLLPIRDGAATPGVLRALALTLRDRQSAEPARLRVPGRDGGWVYLEAAPLSGAGRRIAVTLQRAGRAELGLIALRAHGLTPRETEVTMHVLRGESTRQIADRLCLSPWTVQDHLKAIFAKIGVRSRRDLAMQIFQSPGQPTPASA